MRSSIACQKCRRSKVRCVNHGVGTTCEACQKTGRVCEYPAAGSSGEVPQRRQSLSVGHDAPHDRTAESKTKRRRIAPTSNALKETLPTGTGLFDPQLFTPQVWTELFNIFEQHWATDLPFLHAPTFLDRLCQVDIRSLTDPFGSLVLAFLALTTPFHEAFVRRSWPGAPQPITPIDVAKKYAEAARLQLSGSMNPSKTTLETTQALLMLGLHEWGNSQAISSFLTIGNAIRLAQQLGCQYQDDLDDMQEACVGPLGAPPPRDQSREERLIREEEKRRTYWSCFVMDRYLSSGKYRSRSIHVEDMRIQLPCSERHFNFGLNVRTRMLHEDQEHFNLRHSNYTRSKTIRTPDMANGKGLTKAPSSTRDNDDDVKWEDQGDQEALVWFLKAMDIYGDIIRWSCTVTRRNEKRSPWDHQSTFYQFRKKHEDLKRELPFDLTLSPSRTNTHISARTARGYVLLHTVLTLCSITLHREYLAYLPFGHSKPTGPLDGPIPEGQPDDPEYWEKSARECFKATREFNDLMWTCRQRGVLVETPLTGFAVYHVVFTVLWCAFFPKMDQGNFLCANGTRADELLFDNFDKSWTLLTHIQERLTMAKPWCRDLQKIYQQFKNSKKDHMSWVGSPISNNSNSTDSRRSVKEGGAGLMEYIHFEKSLKEFGDFGKDEYVSVTDDEKVEIDLRRDLDDASEPNSPRVVKSEGGDTIEGSPESDSLAPPQGGFTAVNVSRSDNGTPKSANGHTNTFGSVPPTQGQSFPHHSYNSTFASHSTDNQHLSLRGYPPMAQESDERARAHENHSVQDHSMIDQPVQHMFTPAEGQQMFNQKYNGYEWGMSTSLANFAQGNDFGAIGRGVPNWPPYEMPHQQFYNDHTHH